MASSNLKKECQLQLVQSQLWHCNGGRPFLPDSAHCLRPSQQQVTVRLASMRGFLLVFLCGTVQPIFLAFSLCRREILSLQRDLSSAATTIATARDAVHFLFWGQHDT